jgi:hypothetical protein
MEDPDGATAVDALAVRGLPLVTAGSEYVIGFDATKLAALIGLDDHSQRSRLAGDELVERSRAMLAAAARYARQLPAAHLDDAIPGMEDVEGPLVLPDGTALFHSDGRPFVPHGTAIGLVRHISSHGAKFVYIAQHPEADLSDLAFFGLLGEPSEDVTLRWLVDELAALATEIRHWWETTGDRDLDRSMATWSGPKLLRDVLQDMTYSLTQHTRQLMTMVEGLGIEPDRPLTEEDYRGLDLPTNVWA